MNAITRESSKLGFIGVGYMGRPIAQAGLDRSRLLDVLSETAPATKARSRVGMATTAG